MVSESPCGSTQVSRVAPGLPESIACCIDDFRSRWGDLQRTPHRVNSYSLPAKAAQLCAVNIQQAVPRCAPHRPVNG